MNLHFIPDSGFLNSFISINEKISPADVYVISSGASPFSKPEKKRVASSKVIATAFNNRSFWNAIGDLHQYERVFIHFLDENMCRFIVEAPIGIKFYWIFWGADLYNPYRYFKNEIYDADSLGYFEKHGTFTYTKNPLLDNLKKIKRAILGSMTDRRNFELKREAIKRIQYFLHYNVVDFEIMKRNFKTEAQHLPFFYFEYDYEELPLLPSTDMHEKVNYQLRASRVIQLGNSASLSNNHLSILKALSRISGEDIEIICPLSYGDLRYAKEVMECGKKLFGRKFIPLTRFLPKENYLGLLKCVDILITNHLRTEGAGNVFMMMAMGKKIYCRQESALFKYLDKNQTVLFENESIYHDNPSDLLTLLGTNDQKANRKKIIDLFSIDRAIGNLTNAYRHN